jgi:FtsH-binding integral membrane protein
MIEKNFSTAARSDAQVDVGLREYMLKVYNYMATGLGLTGLTAYFVAITPSLFNAIYGTPLYWVVALAPLGFVFYLSARMQKISFSRAQTMFWLFSGVMGLSMAYIFIAFTGTSIARVFFITAGTFAGMSLYGYTTKKDLSGWGSFLFMGLIGIIIASIVNIFLKSPMLYYVISWIGVLVFVGLTAYDTQRIKEMYYAADTVEISGKKAIMGALRLYLDFINLFIMLLHLFGQRR